MTSLANADSYLVLGPLLLVTREQLSMILYVKKGVAEIHKKH